MSNQPVVLYVEDDALSREVMHIILTHKLGYQHIHIFEDSTNFIPRVELLPNVPDIVLLDIHLRPYDGFEMLRMLREHPTYGQLPVIALTASVMNEEIDQLRHAGFNSVLSKPIDPDTFESTWQMILQGVPVWYITQ